MLRQHATDVILFVGLQEATAEALNIGEEEEEWDEPDWENKPNLASMSPWQTRRRREELVLELARAKIYRYGG